MLDSFFSVVGFSFWLSNTSSRIVVVGSLFIELMIVVGLRWLVSEVGFAFFVSGVWVLRSFGVVIVCALNGTLAEIDDVFA